ncbi:hypothetical protein TUBRATIS_30270, partial [Tubulinosema ratisbonensis]
MKITRKKRDSGTSYLESEKERRRKLFDQISTKKDHKTEKHRLNTYASKPKTATQDPDIAKSFDYDPWSVQKSSYLPDQLDKEKEQLHRETFEENNGMITAKIEFPNKPGVILTFPKSYFDILSKSRLDATPFNKTNTVNPFKSPGLGNQKNHELKDMLTTNLLPGEIDRNNHKNTFNSRTKTESNPFSTQLSDTFKFDTQPVTDKIDENFVKNPETSFEKFKLQECIRNENQESQAHPCILLLLYQKDLFKYLNENMKIENHQTVTNFTKEKTNYDFTTPLVTINTTENTTISTFKEDSKTISFETEKVSTENSLILDEGNSTKSDDITTSTNGPLKKDVNSGDYGISSIGKTLDTLVSTGVEKMGDTSSTIKKIADVSSNIIDKGLGLLTGGDTKASSNLNSLSSDQDKMNKFDVGGNEKTGNKLPKKSEPIDSNKNREYDTTTQPSNVQKTTTKSSTKDEETTPKTYATTTEIPFLTSAKPSEKYDTTTQPSNVQKTTAKSSTKDEETTPKTYTSTTEKPFITSTKPTEKYDTTTKPPSVQKTTTKSSTENKKTTPKTYTSTTEKPSITSAKPTEKYDTTTKPSSVQKTTTKSSIENEKTTPKTHTSTTEKPSITSAKPTEKYDTTTKHS